MDQQRHEMLNGLGHEVRMAVHKAAVEADTTVDVVVQIALGRTVVGYDDAVVKKARGLIATAGLTEKLAALASKWPEQVKPAAPPPAPPVEEKSAQE